MPDQKTNMGMGEKSVAENERRHWARRRWPLLAAACLAAMAGYYSLSLAQPAKGKPGPGGQAMPAAVRATQVKAKDIPVHLTALGSVVPLNTVTVRSRVDGELLEVLFQEGQTVKAGGLLARIDPRPFEVQLAQATGQLLRDQALLENARLDLQRYKELWELNSIPKQQLDTQGALVRQYEGTVKVDQGLVENAKLQLAYSRIVAPISGRVGLRLVDPGNMVRAGDQGGLVVITQIQPISVVFSIPEDSLPRVLEKLKGGARMPVAAYDREKRRVLSEGHLLTVDNQIDAATGTVKLRAGFANKDSELFPNQFVNASLQLEVLKAALVVPSVAVQRGPLGTFVYAIKEDQTAEVRKVTLGETQQNEVVVTSGLAEGDQVVIDGADRLRDGSKVEIRGQGNQGGPARSAR